MKIEPKPLLEAMQKLLKDILKVQSKSETLLWWRGHRVDTWELQPLVYRHKKPNPLDEKSMANRFMRQAPVRYPDCPSNNSKLEWLLLMRHYGLPNRVLDWTESPLNALFFALWEPSHHYDGCLWALDPQKLNKRQIGDGSVTTSHPEFKRIAEEAFQGIQHEDSDKILAMFPIHFDTRMLAQQSVCTIHGMRTSLEKLQDHEDFLWRIPISSDHKKHLRMLLHVLGIRQASLFPDLENLAKELASYEYIEAQQ